MYIGLHVQYRLLLSDCNGTRNYPDIFSKKKNTEISNITKTGPLAAQLLHEDGRTDMTKLIVAFGNSLY